MNKEQTDRISKMESYLDEAKAAIDSLAKALEGYEAIEDKYHKLEDYYGSAEWMADFEADEAGALPADLKRGVLSEDAVYDLITGHREVIAGMKRAALRNTEEDEF